METETLLEVLAHIWAELPGLVGEESWPGFEHELRKLLSRIAAAADQRSLELAALGLIPLFRGHRAAMSRLREVSAQLRRGAEGTGDVMRGRDRREANQVPDPGQAMDLEEASAGFRAFLANTVTRYTDVSCPAVVELDTPRVVVTVGLTRQPLDASRATVGLEVPSDLPVQVSIYAQDMTLLGEAHKELVVRRDEDTAPAVFYLKPESLGRKEIRLEFRQNDLHAGEVRFAVEVVEHVYAERPAAIPGAGLGFGAQPSSLSPYDLEIRIAFAGGRRDALVFELNAPGPKVSYHHQYAGQVELMVSPQEWHDGFMERLSRLREGIDAESHWLLPAQITSGLERLGWELYQALFPPELKALYGQFRESVDTILITSDEPWIPWEMVKPYSTQAGWNDDFMCVQFALARWLAGRGPIGTVHVDNLACVAPRSANLRFSQRERGYFADLAAAHPAVRDLSPEPATASAVASLLDRGGWNLLHVATHGAFDNARPNEASLLLEDGVLSAGDIVGPVREANLRRERPLVFLNACWAGQTAFSLTGLGGWAERLVRLGQCGAFVGPMWPVTDRSASNLARTFYDNLWAGQGVAEALRSARRSVRATNAANPTWLAYSLYAHPKARVTLPI